MWVYHVTEKENLFSLDSTALGQLMPDFGLSQLFCYVHRDLTHIWRDTRWTFALLGISTKRKRQSRDTNLQDIFTTDSGPFGFIYSDLSMLMRQWNDCGLIWNHAWVWVLKVTNIGVETWKFHSDDFRLKIDFYCIFWLKNSSTKMFDDFILSCVGCFVCL